MFLSHTLLHCNPLSSSLFSPPASPPTLHFRLLHPSLSAFPLSPLFCCLLSHIHHHSFSFSPPRSHLFTYRTFKPFLAHKKRFALLSSSSWPRLRCPSCVAFSLPSFLLFFSFLSFHLLSCSAPAQRAPGASPSAHNISSAAVSDRTNFSRGVGIRSTFHAGQQRSARDQHGSAYPGGPASPSLSHGNSQARRTHGATGIFSKFTSKFVRKWVTGVSRTQKVNTG